MNKYWVELSWAGIVEADNHSEVKEKAKKKIMSEAHFIIERERKLEH